MADVDGVTEIQSQAFGDDSAGISGGLEMLLVCGLRTTSSSLTH